MSVIEKETLMNSKTSKLDELKVVEAAKALLKIILEKNKTDNQLIDSVTPIQLQYTFKKIPQFRNKKVATKVPNSLITEDTEICLFVKDVHKGADDQEDKRDYEPSVRFFKDMVSTAGIKGVEEFIPLIRLKREFREFETKRKLCDSYDLFLCDDRVAKFLPKLLGKTFYQKKKMPINVKLDAKHVKSSFHRVLNSVHGLITGAGSSQSMTVSHSGLTAEQTAANIIEVVKRLVTIIPGGWTNLRNLYITTTNTTSVPIFVSTESANLVQLSPDKKKKRRLIASGDPGLFGDEEDADDGQVEVFDDGTVIVKGVDDEKTITKPNEKKNTKGKKHVLKQKPVGKSDKQKRTKMQNKENEIKKADKQKGKNTKPKGNGKGQDHNPPGKKQNSSALKGPLSKKPRLE